MKTIFIEAKYNGMAALDYDLIKKLPKRVGLVSTIQFIDFLKSFKEQIERSGKKACICGQVLGCDFDSAIKMLGKVDCFLFVGTGNFHPLGLAYKANKPVFIYDPITKISRVIDENEVEKYKKKERGALLKFLAAKNVGVIMSTKPGQDLSSKALLLKKMYKEKKFYLFISNTIDLNEIENFSYIDSWVNTACPRMAEDTTGLLNLEDLINFGKSQKDKLLK